MLDTRTPKGDSYHRGEGGVKSDSIKELANPAPGIFLAKAKGSPASIASFRDKCKIMRPRATRVGDECGRQV